MAETETSNQPSPYRRKTLMVNRPFQMSLILFGLSISLSLIVLNSLMYLTLHWQFEALIGMGPEEETKFLHSLLQTSDALYFKFLMFSIALTVTCIGVGGLLVTNRVAGPVYRATNALDALNRGETPEPIAFRKGDFFPEFQESLNTYLEKKLKSKNGKNEKQA